MEQFVEWCRKELERKIELFNLLASGAMKITEKRNDGEMKDTTQERAASLDQDIKALQELINKHGR
jgi:hypothetical protein